jgi:hypothetical protein
MKDQRGCECYAATRSSCFSLGPSFFRASSRSKLALQGRLIFIGLAIAASIPLMLGWLSLVRFVGSCYAGWRTFLAGERPTESAAKHRHCSTRKQPPR